MFVALLLCLDPESSTGNRSKHIKLLLVLIFSSMRHKHMGLSQTQVPPQEHEHDTVSYILDKMTYKP